MALRALLTTWLAVHCIGRVYATTWCGKNYLPGEPVIPPGGEFRIPETSNQTLLAFRCSPAYRPYVEGEDTIAAVIVDTQVTYKKIAGAEPIDLSNSQQELSARQSSSPPISEAEALQVTVSMGGNILVQANVNVNGTGAVLQFNLTGFEARQEGYEIDCEGVYNGTSTYKTSTSLLYLPRTSSSVVKMDIEAGSLMAKPANGSSGNYSYVVPYGFYSDYSYLASNLEALTTLKSQGINTIHPIPPYGDVTEFSELLTAAQKADLYVIYDMQDDYQNLATVASLVETYKSAPNLLAWHTAHEADGHSYAPSDTVNAYNKIYELDGFHPVSIVLNCEDFYFEEYVSGSDIVAEDAYPIGINPTWSDVYDTVCDKDFGRCGCDNCIGSLADKRSRIATFADRLEILGFERSKTIWTVPQAIGSEEYWKTTPTGQQWAAMHVLALQHGAKGAVSFNYPATNGSANTIEGIASDLSHVVLAMEPYVTSDIYHFTSIWYEGVDLGLWKAGEYTYLLTGVNVNGAGAFVPWEISGIPYQTLNVSTQLASSLSINQTANATGLIFEPGGVAVYTVNI